MDLPPIYRDAKRLVILVEQVVKQFPRYHRYTLGTDLRQQAMKLLRLAVPRSETPRSGQDFLCVTASTH